MNERTMFFYDYKPSTYLIRGQPASGRGNKPQNTVVRPKGNNSQVSARVVALNKEDSNASAVVEGTLFISGKEARVLIDPGSTHSFIATLLYML
jgi:hypothetical protein